MRQIIGLGACVGTLAAVVVFANGGAVATIAYDNVHIGVTDPAKAGEWYVKYLGATPTATAGRVFVGKTLIRFVRRDTPPSGSGPIDHIGLSYTNLDAKVTELEAAGAKVTTAPRDVAGLFRIAFVEDPWRVRIEVVQDPGVLGFHHVHVRVRDPKASLDWCQEMFGGERGQLKGRIDGLRYGDVWLLAAGIGNAPPPVAGGPIQNIAWQVPDAAKGLELLKSRGAKPFREVTRGKVEGKDIATAFVEDADGVRIELIQR